MLAYIILRIASSFEIVMLECALGLRKADIAPCNINIKPFCSFMTVSVDISHTLSMGLLGEKTVVMAASPSGILDDVGLNGNAYWGFMSITDEQFNKIIELGQADGRYFID